MFKLLKVKSNRPFRPLHVRLSNFACNLSIHLPYTGNCCPERLLYKSSKEKKSSEICIREQFVTRMFRCGGEIENGDFDKGKEANV